MAESQNVGGIHYDVAMDVRQMLSGERQVDSSLDRMEGNFNKASKSIDGAEKSMLSFSKAALAVTSAISVGAVVSMVDEWGQVAARIKMALKSVEGDIEKYGEIQERFLEISNRNGKAIEDTQLLYVGAATSMQELGYSTEQTVDYIESLSSSLTANAASANETQSMINALNKSMVSGKVAGENWNSIMNATPTLIGDIAKQLSIMRGGVKVTEQEVKKMAADGKISFELLADSTIRARDANNAMADSMDNTVADGFTKLTNSAKSYFGELNQSLGITREISAGFAVLSNNFDKVAAAAVIASAVIGARYVGALSSSIKAKITDAAASAKQVLSIRSTALAVREETLAIINNLTAEKAKIAAQNQWMASQSVINRQMGLNISYQKEYQANAIRMAAIDTQMTAAKTQLAAATTQASIANRAYAASANMLRSGLALIGGPMGAAMLAAGAIFYFYQKSQEAKQEALAFADSIEELKNKMKDMSDIALMGNIAEASKSIDVQKESIKDLQSELEILRNNYKWTSESTSEWQNRSKNLAIIQRDIAIKTKELEEAQDKLAKTTKYVSDVTGELADRNKDLYDAMNSASGMAGKMGSAIGALQQRIKAAADEKARLNNEMRDNPKTDDAEKAILNLQEQNELLGIKDKRLRAIRKAEIEANKLTKNPNQLKVLVAEATANYDAIEAERERSKGSKESTKATDEAGNALKRLQAELTRLNQGYAEGSLELAQYDAAQALGAKASPQQIALAKERAKSIWEMGKATRNLSQAEQGRKYANQEIAAAKVAVNPITEMAEDPLAQINLQEQQKLDALEKYRLIDTENAQLYEDAKTAIVQQAALDRLEVSEREKNREQDNMLAMLGNSSNLFGEMAGLVGDYAGESGKAYKGLFAVSKGFAIAQGLINLQTAIGNAMALPWPLNIPAIATAAAAGANMISTIRGVNYGGARYNGGAVNAGEMYRVGEHGKPEIYQASSGKQYMIPGDNGKVISNKDMQGGGGGVQAIINIQNYTSASVDARATEGSNGVTIDVIVADIYRGGQISQAIERNHQAPRRATE